MLPNESSWHSPLGEPPAAFDVVETSTDGRFVRYAELLGRGACKRVYRAMDTSDGREVAWNQVELTGAEVGEDDDEKTGIRARLFEEISVLQGLRHKNVMAFHSWWFSTATNAINFVTEMFSSGTLRQYRKRCRHVNENVIKRWAWQICEGLVYLHGHTPPIVHRDLKCDNIFVNGTTGQVKIGDLGLATAQRGLSVVGTPEFMAPEIYDEEYDEKVDVYSFGMCLLELATCEYPYSECHGVAQIYRKVTSGIVPQAITRVASEPLRRLIELCINHDASVRPSARQLLKHTFFDSLREGGVPCTGSPRGGCSTNHNGGRSTRDGIFASSGIPFSNGAASTSRLVVAVATSPAAAVAAETNNLCIGAGIAVNMASATDAANITVQMTKASTSAVVAPTATTVAMSAALNSAAAAVAATTAVPEAAASATAVPQINGLVHGPLTKSAVPEIYRNDTQSEHALSESWPASDSIVPVHTSTEHSKGRHPAAHASQHTTTRLTLCILQPILAPTHPSPAADPTTGTDVVAAVSRSLLARHTQYPVPCCISVLQAEQGAADTPPSSDCGEGTTSDGDTCSDGTPSWLLTISRRHCSRPLSRGHSNATAEVHTALLEVPLADEDFDLVDSDARSDSSEELIVPIDLLQKDFHLAGDQGVRRDMHWRPNSVDMTMPRRSTTSFSTSHTSVLFPAVAHALHTLTRLRHSRFRSVDAACSSGSQRTQAAASAAAICDVSQDTPRTRPCSDVLLRSTWSAMKAGDQPSSPSTWERPIHGVIVRAKQCRELSRQLARLPRSRTL